MKIPNFDDKDLAIVTIGIVAVAGFITGIIIKADPSALYAFGGMGITGIAALATGRKKEVLPVAD